MLYSFKYFTHLFFGTMQNKAKKTVFPVQVFLFCATSNFLSLYKSALKI